MATLTASCMVSMIILLAACGPQSVLGSNAFLHDKGTSSEAFREEIMNAMGSMLGCGGQHDPEEVAAITSALTPMWRTLPKTNGRIDRRSLRYLVHRHFMKTSSLMVRGFEPTRLTNESHWGAADILSQMVPAYVESVLESQHSTLNGFSLKDAVDMVVMLDQLIFDSESAILEGVYKDQWRRHDKSLSSLGLMEVLTSYMVRWMINGSPEDHAALDANVSLAREIMPNYDQLIDFAEGRIKTFEYTRQLTMGTGKQMKSNTKDTWSMRYSFNDAHTIAGGITRSFQSYWQSECNSMKTALVGMDSHSTGRVPLSKFYNTAINSDWRFGESEVYLRELGALDETSSWRGPQVIIPNYMQATSNCIVATSHYLVCCENECETLMGEIEVAIDAPTALPETILSVVGGITPQPTVDDDEPSHLNEELRQQLEKIAKSHGGRVPLHGRLFAQWLHYVFPRECPFPNKAGASSATPTEFGGNYVATQADMVKYASTASSEEIPVSVSKEELQWMSQWSEDEVLIMDYSAELSGSWSRPLLVCLGLMLAVAGVAGGSVTLSSGSKVGASARDAGMTRVSHAHWV